MNAEETRKAVEVMMAYAEGKPIQVRKRQEPRKWFLLEPDKPFWNWQEAEYRIAPEPREWWVNVYPDGEAAGAYVSKAKADKGAALSRIECIHVREVLED